MPRPMTFLAAHAPDGLLAPGGLMGTSHRFFFLRSADEKLLFDAYRRKTSKVVPYKMGSGAALGAFRVIVGRH